MSTSKCWVVDSWARSRRWRTQCSRPLVSERGPRSRRSRTSRSSRMDWSSLRISSRRALDEGPEPAGGRPAMGCDGGSATIRVRGPGRPPRLSEFVAEEFPRDHEPPDFARTGADLEQLRIPREPLQREVAHVSVAPVDLDGGEGVARGGLRGEREGRRALPEAPPVARDGVEGRVREAASRLQVRVHVRDLGLDQLEMTDLLTELLPGPCVGHALLEAFGQDADRYAGEHRALDVQATHHDRDPLVLGTDQLVGRDLAVLERELPGGRTPHPHLVEALCHAEAGSLAR